MKSSSPKIFKGLYADYELREVLKSGKMATIWKGQNLTSGDPVAIKLYHTVKWENSERLQKKLAKEGLTTKLLEHESICKVLDFFYTEDGHNGLVMEYLDGMDLSEFITRRGRQPLPIATALKLIKDVGKALDYAHNLSTHNPVLAAKNYHKVLHQDIKPANIFLTSNNEIKLIDFGISRVDSEETELNHMGYGFTRTYTAPDLWDASEKFLGEKYVEAHDLYSLGLVFYELVTGKEAFKSITQARTGKIKSLTTFGDFAPEVVEFFNRWTHIDPSKRLHSAQDLDTEITALLQILETPTLDIKGELDSLKELPFHVVEHTVQETIKLTSSHGHGDDSQREFFKLCLKSNLLQLAVHPVAEKKLATEVQAYCQANGVETRNLSRNDDILMKALFDTFKKLFPKTAEFDWSDFRNMMLDRDRLINFFSSVLSKKECYRFYQETFSFMEDISVKKDLMTQVLFNFRSGFQLDPFECDEQDKKSPLEEYVSCVGFLKMLFDENGAEARDYAQKNFKIQLSRTDRIIRYMLTYKKSEILRAKPVIPLEIRQAIYALLGKLASADKEISIAERAILENIKVSLGDEQLSFGALKGKSIAEIFELIPAGAHAFVISRFLMLVFSKIRLSDREKSVFYSVAEQIKKSKCFEQLKEPEVSFLLEPIFANSQKLKHQSELLSEFRCWVKLSPEQFSDITTKYNHLRFIFDEPPMAPKFMTDLLESVNGKNRRYQLSPDNTFILEYYLYVQMKVCLKQRAYATMASSLMRDYSPHPELKSPGFVYHILKHYLHFQVVHSFFGPVLEMSRETETELWKMMIDLKISRNDLIEALNMIKLNFNVTLVLPSYRATLAA